MSSKQNAVFLVRDATNYDFRLRFHPSERTDKEVLDILKSETRENCVFNRLHLSDRQAQLLEAIYTLNGVEFDDIITEMIYRARDIL